MHEVKKGISADLSHPMEGGEPSFCSLKIISLMLGVPNGHWQFLGEPDAGVFFPDFRKVFAAFLESVA